MDFCCLANFDTSSAYNKNPIRTCTTYACCRLSVMLCVEREPWRPQTQSDSHQSSPGRNVGTAVYHAQYNSPIGLYSDDKVLEAFKSQTGSLIEDIKGYRC
jgi:hypothetical protein